MTRLRELSAVVSGCAVALGACSTAGPAHGVCKEYTACTLLTASDVGRALGATVSAGAENDQNTSTTSSQPESVECDFAPGGAVIAFKVTCDSAPTAVNRVYPSPFTPINDGVVGEQAYWADMTTDGGAAGGQLVSWVNTHVTVTLTMTPPNQGSFGADPMAAAIQMAQAAIPRL